MNVDRDHLKRLAALRAIEEVKDGMVVGLGTGSTAAHVVEGLATRVAHGLRVVGIPTSERTAAQARRLGIPTATFAEHQRLDLTIDGADEVQLGSLDLIKGLGGALLREKIVAAASDRLIIVVDQEKLVERLGEYTPVPVEVTQSAGRPRPPRSPSSAVCPSGVTRRASSPTLPMVAIFTCRFDLSPIPTSQSNNSR
jgi:ribose 5-phosphate isomerase A